MFFQQEGSYRPCVEPSGQHNAEVFMILSSSVCRRPQVDMGLDLETHVELIHGHG